MSDKNNNDHYVGAILEEVKHMFAAIMEGQQSMTHTDVRRLALTVGSAATVERFDVLITTDQSLEYQQNLRELGLAIVVLVAESATE